MKETVMILEIELVPSTVWYSSLYRLLPREVWDNIRNEIIKEYGRKCQICGETEGVMNLHEIWKYDDVKHIQKLEGFILLCKMCHHVSRRIRRMNKCMAAEIGERVADKVGRNWALSSFMLRIYGAKTNEIEFLLFLWL